MLNIVLFGPPGAGKGTQSESLIQKYGLIHLSPGEILRSNIKNNTDLGVLASSYIDKGNLVPNEVVIEIIKSEVYKHHNPKGFIFDGFPRTQVQAKALDVFLSEINESVTIMLDLQVPKDDLLERLINRSVTSNRVDDSDISIIEKRIDVYLTETFPVKSFYTEQNKCKEINGTGTVNQTFNLICEQIYKVSTLL